MTDKSKALIAIVIVNFIWGLDFIAIEFMMNYVSPPVYTLMELIIVNTVLLSAVFIKHRGIKIRREDLLHVFIAGAVGMSLYFTVENLGTGLTSASFSSFIMSTVPIFGLIADRLFYGGKITYIKIICIIGSIIGVYLLVKGEPMGVSLKGLVVMLIASMLWTFYVAYVKPLYDKYDLLTLLSGLFLSGFIVQIPITLATVHSIDSFYLEPKCILVTVGASLICIISGEFGYVYAVGKLSVTTVSIFENVLPLTTVIIAFFVFHTMLTGVQLIGGAIIMASVSLLVLKE